MKQLTRAASIASHALCTFPAAAQENVVACLLLPHARADARLRASCVALLVRELCAPGGSAALLMAQRRARLSARHLLRAAGGEHAARRRSRAQAHAHRVSQLCAARRILLSVAPTVVPPPTRARETLAGGAVVRLTHAHAPRLTTSACCAWLGRIHRQLWREALRRHGRPRGPPVPRPEGVSRAQQQNVDGRIPNTPSFLPAVLLRCLRRG
jgi:hypothetical protein